MIHCKCINAKMFSLDFTNKARESKLFSVVIDNILQMRSIEYNLYQLLNIALNLQATVNAKHSNTTGRRSVGLDNTRYLHVVFSNISFWDLLLNFFPVKRVIH